MPPSKLPSVRPDKSRPHPSFRLMPRLRPLRMLVRPAATHPKDPKKMRTGAERGAARSASVWEASMCWTATITCMCPGEMACM